MKKNTKNNFKKIIISLIPLIAFSFSCWLLALGVKAYLENSSYFKVKKVILYGLDDKKIAQDISRVILYDNIFNLNLKKIRKDLKNANPNFYDVDVIRNFPDQVTVNIIVRKPIAQINHRGFFLVDSEGVIVSDMSNKPFINNIVISGLRNISKFSFGKKINLAELNSGLRLAQIIKDPRKELFSLFTSVTYDKIEIDISKYPSLYLNIDNLELRFYDYNLENELKALIRILPSLEKRIKQVEYIDLRFDEPAVYFKNEKKNIVRS